MKQQFTGLLHCKCGTSWKRDIGFFERTLDMIFALERKKVGYKEINYRAMKLLPRGGYLATASCSHFATEELFIKMLKAAAKDAHRQLRQIEVRQQAPDHPILWGVPETNYLKFFLFQVI